MKVSKASLETKAHEVRNLILDMCTKAKTGHVTSSLSCVEIMVALYYGGVMKFDPSKPDWSERDRFILSKGQASVILYPILADLGYFPKEQLDDFAQKGGKFGVHLQHDVPGTEITSGSLGQGFNIATGMALAMKKNRSLPMVFTLLGDGECYEGSMWEAAMFAAHNKLNNLVAIIDRNYQCVTNFTENMVALEPMEDKWRSFGWWTERIDGHDFDALMSVLRRVRSRQHNKPLMIIADTVKGQGISFMECVPIWHGAAPDGEDAKKAKAELA
ncbi:MAG: transketolase [Proteobacteria bacterium]|nr:transketolase [Pseudomonadota bacterium]